MKGETQLVADWWAKPRREATWITNYQASLTVRHRDAISEIVGTLPSVTTLLEVGCHCGPNLMRLTEDYPTLQATGIDVNAQAVEAGTQWAKTRGVADRVTIHTAMCPTDTEAWPSGSFGVVLSCYCLAYISPADRDAVLYELGRLATKAVILAEPMTFDGPSGATRTASGYQEWAHDYQAAAPWIGSWRGASLRIVPVSPPVDRLNAVLVVDKSAAISGGAVS